MPAPANPSEIAREVLKLIAVRRLPPTPDNFRRLYHEVAGTPDGEEAFPEKFVRGLARQLPRDTAERLRLARSLDQALAEGRADPARQALAQYLESMRADQAPGWNELIGTLLRQWEARQFGWTTARKREALERVLAGNDPATLYTRLQGLTRSWAQAPADPEAAPVQEAAAPAADAGALAATEPVAGVMIRMVAPGHAGEYLAGLRELVLLTLDSVVPAVLGDVPELADEAARFAAEVGSATTADELRRIAARLRKFAYRLEMAAGDRAEVRAGLLNLFRLLLENIDQIVVDDRWLHGQIEALRDVVDKPASVRLIDDAERRLKEVIYKQSQLKHNLSEAQRNLQAMLAGFVDQLALFAETTGTYHDTISVCAQKIGAARDITAIGHLLDEVMRETRSIQAHAQRSRDDLQATRRRAADAEARIDELQEALEEASRQMRHDPLTGVLNERGLAESFEKEAARALRRHAPLAVALLDLDHFKTLNDTWGDQTGDDALVHLTGVVRQNLRPQDSIARRGGEEFILLYPETDLLEATAALVRLQRELTRAFFLAGDTRILITFSAGVTAWQAGEDLETVLERAGAAMQEAVKSGKNKVVAVGADSPQAH